MVCSRIFKRSVINCIVLIVILAIAHVFFVFRERTLFKEVQEYRTTWNDFLKPPLYKTSVVFTYQEGTWREDYEACQPVDQNVTILKSPSGDIPLYLTSSPVYEDMSDTLLSDNTWETNMLKEVYEIMKNNVECSFIDIGVHLGVYTLTFARMGRRVLAIESEPNAVQKLCSLVKKAGLEDQVFIFENVLEKTVRLDDLLESFSLSRVVVKIDTETVNATFLAGAEKFFSTVDVVALLMQWKFYREKESGEKIIQFLDRHKMKPFLAIYRHSPLSSYKPSDWPPTVLWLKSYDPQTVSVTT